MAPCKNDPKRYYTGKEPSPKGLGWCAHTHPIGQVRKGKNKKRWIVRSYSRTKRWVPHKKHTTKPTRPNTITVPKKPPNKKPNNVTLNIHPPPFFAKPAPNNRFEGYWSKNYRPQSYQLTNDQHWKDKPRFMAAVKRVEDYLNKNFMGRYRYDGMAVNRMSPGKLKFVGDGSEYVGKDFRWPYKYVEHYIGQYNVMPSKRFFDYIVQRDWVIPRLLASRV